MMDPAQTSRLEEEQALRALRAVKLDYVMRMDGIWDNPPYDVSAIHHEWREEYRERLDELLDDEDLGSPLAWVFLGSAGSGKTHLLSALRRETLDRKALFIHVDMTDVTDFWETVLQGYLDSLVEPRATPKNQFMTMVEGFIDRFYPGGDAERRVQLLINLEESRLLDVIDRLIKEFHSSYRHDVNRHSDVIRSLFLTLSSNLDLMEIGESWLRGLPVGDSERKRCRLRHPMQKPVEIIRGLSWFASLSTPTVISFDQLDPIIIQQNYEALAHDPDDTRQENRALSVIEGVASGLRQLHSSVTTRTLIVLTCLESVWEILRKLALRANLDCFESPRQLGPVRTAENARMLIENRLCMAYVKNSFREPYKSWPFRPEAFEDPEIQSLTPRRILQACHQHIMQCRRDQAVRELTSLIERPTPGPDTEPAPEPEAFAQLDQMYAEARRSANIAPLLDERNGDEQWTPLLLNFMGHFVNETPLPENIIPEVEALCGATHITRLRLIFTEENDREEHFYLCSLQRRHVRSFQAHLRDAMVHSGIEKDFSFRHLVILRTEPLPTGPRTEELLKTFVERGGRHYRPPEEDMRALVALDVLAQKNHPLFSDWLQARRPASKLTLAKMAAGRLLELGLSEKAPEKGGTPNPGSGLSPSAVSPQAPSQPVVVEVSEDKAPPTSLTNGVGPSHTNVRVDVQTVISSPLDSEWHSNRGGGAVVDTHSTTVSGTSGTPVAARPRTNETVKPASPITDGKPVRTGRILLGYSTDAAPERAAVSMPIGLLEKHTVVLAGAGSGKTVLLRRLVEDAALQGIPAIIIDGANDLSTMGEKASAPLPEGVLAAEDMGARYLDRTQTVIWTPGRESANPMRFDPLPDFTALRQDPDDLEEAVDMAAASLSELIINSQSQKAFNQQGVLTAALRYFAEHCDGGLAELIHVLNDMPEAASLHIQKEQVLARELADALKVKLQTTPLLRSTGTPMDPATLFGDDAPDDKTRISVINLSGINDLSGKCQFVNQLAMTLFAWIRRHPRPVSRPLQGLLVIDEAKEFVPAVRSCACKNSLMRLAAQARKYHLGIILATQNPKEIDNAVVGNCSTHYYGKANSPNTIAVIQEQMRQRGGAGSDISRLKPGRFYVYNADADLERPQKIINPFCRSNHRSDPPGPDEIYRMARRSAKELRRP